MFPYYCTTPSTCILYFPVRDLDRSDQLLLKRKKKTKAGGKGWRVKLHLYLPGIIFSIVFSQLNGGLHSEVPTTAGK